MIHWAGSSVPYFGPDSAFYADPWTISGLTIKTAIANNWALENAFKWMDIYDDIINLMKPKYWPEFVWESNVWEDPANAAATIVKEWMDLLYSDYYDYHTIIFSWWINPPDFYINKITKEPSSYIKWPIGFSSSPQTTWFKTNLPKNSFPSRWDIIWAWATCFSKDECISFWWMRVETGDDGIDRLKSSDNYFYYDNSTNNKIVKTWQVPCNVMRQCDWPSCKTSCILPTDWWWFTQEITSPKCPNFRARCEKCQNKKCYKDDDDGWWYCWEILFSKSCSSLPSNCTISVNQPLWCLTYCNKPTFSKYWMNLLKQHIPGLVERHHPRFRQIDGKIYMIWWFSFNVPNNNWNIKETNRGLINQVFEFNNVSLSPSNCPNFPEKVPPNNIENPIDKIASNGYLPNNLSKRWIYNDTLTPTSSLNIIVDLIKIWGDIKQIVMSGKKFKIGWYELPWISWNRYFFNSQSFCPDDNTCYYSISWWNKTTIYENPKYKANKRMYSSNWIPNPEADFLSDFHVWKIKKNWASLDIIKLDEDDWVPSSLPKGPKWNPWSDLKSYPQWRILHQVTMSVDKWEWGELEYKFSVYWWKVIDKVDMQWAPIKEDGENPDCTLKTSDDWEWEWDGYNDYLQYARCRWKNLYPMCNSEWTDVWAPFDPSLFLSDDNYNVYTWSNNNGEDESPKWTQYNFFMWKIEDDDTNFTPNLNQIKVNSTKESINSIKGMLLDGSHTITTTLKREWSWENHPYRSWLRIRHEDKWVVLNWKSKIPLEVKYAKNSDNLKINLMPIQSLKQDNNLTFSWNFDFSTWSWKTFIWAVLKWDEGEDSWSFWFNPKLLNKIISVEPFDRTLQFVQCLPLNSSTYVDSLSCTDTNNNESVAEYNSLNDLDEYSSCEPNLGASRRYHWWKRVYRPPIILNKNPSIFIKKESSEAEYKIANFWISKDPGIDINEKGNFIVERKFEPWVRRVHIWIFATDNPDTINTSITASQWAWFMWTMPTWRWTWHASRMWYIQPEELWLDNFDAAWPLTVYYRSFEFEFTVPKITNLWNKDISDLWNNDISDIPSENLIFNWAWVASGSQILIYWTWSSGIFRINDVLQNVPKLARKWSYFNPLGWLNSNLTENTSEKTFSPTLLLENSPMHLKIRPTKPGSETSFWDFSFKSIFPFEIGKLYTLAYTYIDELWNIIWWPKKEFRVWYSNKVILNHKLLGDILYETDSNKPFINWSYKKNKILRAVISEGVKFEEIVVQTDNNWFFRIKPETKLIFWKTYDIKFSSDNPSLDVWKFKIKVAEVNKPEIINLYNNSSLHYKRPIFIWNAEADTYISFEIFIEDQTFSNEDIKCKEKKPWDFDGILYTCNDLWKMWDIEEIFASWTTLSDEYWNFSWQITKDLIEQKTWETNNPNSINNYFIKAFYEGSDNYDLISFRYKNDEIKKLPSIINTNSKYFSTDFDTKYNLFKFPAFPDLKVLILGEWEIMMKWTLWFRLASNSKLKLLSSGKLSYLSKWSSIISSGTGQQKFIFTDIVESQLLGTWTIIISSSQWSSLKFSNPLNSVKVKVSPKTEIYSSWSLVWSIQFKSDMDFYTNDLVRLMQFNCKDTVFKYVNPIDVIKNKDLCKYYTSTTVNDDISPSVITPVQWWVYKIGDLKYKFSWNAWPNTKIRIRSGGNKILWSTTTDEQWRFTFWLPEQYIQTDTDFFNSKSILIQIDNDETNSTTQVIKISAIIPYNQNSKNPDSFADDLILWSWSFKDKDKLFNESVKNIKTPLSWDLY